MKRRGWWVETILAIVESAIGWVSVGSTKTTGDPDLVADKFFR